MKNVPIITSVEIIRFQMEVKDRAPDPEIPYFSVYTPGKNSMQDQYAIRIHSDQGVTGECVVARGIEVAGIPALTPILLGQNALERESFHKHANRATRQSARMGVGAVDVALWDLAGKYFDAPIYRLLGGHRTRLPAYASTWIADRNGGLATPQEFADFAEECLNMGYKGFKIHPWPKINIPEEIETINQVGKRVAGKMDLMTDPACAYDTFADAVKVGRACDEWNFFWYEDPFKDGGVSQFAHRKLRQLIKTPLLQCEHIRGLEQHVDFIVAEATDFVRGDIWYDGGITGSIKLARACEGFGLDVEFHAGGPAERQTMAAIHNSNYYEAGLVHPREPREQLPYYKSYYQDGLAGIGEDGCFEVPDGPGLGVEYDWNYITQHQVETREFK